MNKCLVTKLNGVVNNDDLLKIGELRIKIPAGISPVNNASINNKVRLLGLVGTVVYLKDMNLYNYDGNTKLSGPGEKYVCPDNFVASVDTASLNKEGTLIIMDKYKLTDFSTPSSVNEIDDTFSWYTKILGLPGIDFDKSKLNLLNKDIKQLTVGSYNGDIVDFSKFKNLTSIGISANVNMNETTRLAYGNINSLGSLTQLMNFSCSNQVNLKGTIESFVQAQRQNGRTECSTPVTFSSFNTKITFDGNVIGQRISITWNATTITVNDKTITA